MFVLWHHLCRIAFPLLFIICGGSILLPREPWVILVINISYIALAALAVTSVLLTLALCFFKFRFTCPRCRSKNTAFGMHEKRLWLNCDDCGLTEETGFLKLQLKFTPKTELEDAP
jgi:hypothetical protein